jgi:hypothetical protein
MLGAAIVTGASGGQCQLIWANLKTHTIGTLCESCNFLQLGFEKDKPNIDKVGAWNKEMTESCDYRRNPHEGGCTRDFYSGKGQKERRTAIKSAANKLSQQK